MMNQDQQSQLKLLIAKGKEQGFLTYSEVNDHLPDDIVDPEQIEDIIAMINDMGITVHEIAPDTDTLILSDSSVRTMMPRRKRLRRWPRSTANSAAPPTRCACTCARWARWNC